MPNLKSAKKRLKQSLKARTRNRAGKAAIKTQVRKLTEAVASGDLKTAQDEARALAKRVDQAASKGIIHRNAAARLKSRAAKRIKSAKTTAAAK